MTLGELRALIAEARATATPLREALELLNSLGIAGPNIRHVEQTEPDPKWDADERAVWDVARDQRWCLCGRVWPCEALALDTLIRAALSASDRKEP